MGIHQVPGKGFEPPNLTLHGCALPIELPRTAKTLNKCAKLPLNLYALLKAFNCRKGRQTTESTLLGVFKCATPR